MNNALETALKELIAESGRNTETVRIILEVPLRHLDFDKCHCEPDSISGECEGVPFSSPVWDVDLAGLSYVGEEVEPLEADRERIEEYLIELRRAGE